MSTPLIVVSTLIYLGVAIDQLMKGSVGTGVLFVGYTIANIGILMVVR